MERTEIQLYLKTAYVGGVLPRTGINVSQAVPSLCYYLPLYRRRRISIKTAAWKYVYHNPNEEQAQLVFFLRWYLFTHHSSLTA
jgi:hypothetical protein